MSTHPTRLWKFSSVAIVQKMITHLCCFVTQDLSRVNENDPRSHLIGADPTNREWESLSMIFIIDNNQFDQLVVAALVIIYVVVD